MGANSQTKQFATEVVVSVYFDLLLCEDFSLVHECMNHVFGCDLFTTQLRGKVREACVKSIFEQVPDISKARTTLNEFQPISEANVEQVTDRLRGILGDQITLRSGSPIEENTKPVLPDTSPVGVC